MERESGISGEIFVLTDSSLPGKQQRSVGESWGASWGARSLGFGVLWEVPRGGSMNVHSLSLKLQMLNVSETDSYIRQRPALRVSD